MLTIQSSFPFNRVLDQAVVNLGAGFGFGDGVGGAIPDGEDQGRQGSWVDDLTVYTFGRQRLVPLAARHWTVYKGGK